MESKKRQFIILGLTISGLVITALGITFNHFRAYWFSLVFLNNYHPGDMVDITADIENFSTILCEGYQVSTYPKADIYLLPYPPQVDKNKNDIQKNVLYSLSSDEDFTQHTYRLLPGSVVNVTACFRRGAPSEVLFIKGDNNLDLWKSNRACTSCVWKRMNLDSKSNCTASMSATLTGMVTSEETVHVLLSQQKIQKASYFNVELEAVRTLYDVSGYTEKCNMSEENCVLNVTYNTNPSIVVQFPVGRFEKYTSVTPSCKPRIVFAVCVLGILPVCLIVIVSVILCVLYHRLCKEKHFQG